MIVPRPASAHPADGFYTLSADTRLFAPADDAARAVAELLRAALKDSAGLDLPLSDAADGTGGITLALDQSLTTGDEGYTLEAAADGVTIRAAAPAGLFYGAQSLRQMVDLETTQGNGPRVPLGRIEDAPRYAWRGMMLDSSRHFQPVATIKRLMDALAYLKMNVFHWHLVDDNGWRLEIKRYPRLTGIASRRDPDEPDASGFYTQDEARDIVAYAKARNITIIPEIEVPAHASAALAVYPELTCAGEPWEFGNAGLHYFQVGTRRATFCPSREETYEFLEGVLTEVMDIFDGPVIHIGGDERPDGIWADCPRCAETMRREGMEKESALQHAMMCRLADFVNRHGRRTMAWLPTAEHGLPENQIAEDWFYDLIPDATALGNDVVNAQDRWTYLDYPNFPGRQKPEWMHDLAIEKMYDFEPTPEGMTEEQQKRMLGAHTSLWTEFIEEEDLSTAIFPRLLAFAEVMWTPRARRNWDDFARRKDALEPIFERMGWPYATLEREQGVRTARPATVSSSMAHEAPYQMEHAFDGRFTRYAWTVDPPKKGDHLTVTLDEPIPARRITLHTGSDFARDDFLPEGTLAISADGETFTPVAAVRGRRADAHLNGDPVKAVRVLVDADMERRLATREIVIV